VEEKKKMIGIDGIDGRDDDDDDDDDNKPIENVPADEYEQYLKKLDPIEKLAEYYLKELEIQERMEKSKLQHDLYMQSFLEEGQVIAQSLKPPPRHNNNNNSTSNNTQSLNLPHQQEIIEILDSSSDEKEKEDETDNLFISKAVVPYPSTCDTSHTSGTMTHSDTTDVTNAVTTTNTTTTTGSSSGSTTSSATQPQQPRHNSNNKNCLIASTTRPINEKKREYHQTQQPQQQSISMTNQLPSQKKSKLINISLNNSSQPHQYQQHQQNPMPFAKLKAATLFGGMKLPGIASMNLPPHIQPSKWSVGGITNSTGLPHTNLAFHQQNQQQFQHVQQQQQQNNNLNVPLMMSTATTSTTNNGQVNHINPVLMNTENEEMEYSNFVFDEFL
jgi:hypothetical protein